MKDPLIIEEKEGRNLLRLIIPESRQIKTQTIFIPTIILDAKKVAYKKLKGFAEQIGADFVVAEVIYSLTHRRAYCANVSFYSNTVIEQSQ